MAQLLPFSRSTSDAPRPRPSGAEPAKAPTTMQRQARQYLNRGLVLSMEGNLQEAYQFYCRALRLDPNNRLSHYMLGITLKAMGRDDEARAQWWTALTLPGAEEADPDAATNVWVLGMSRRLLEEDVYGDG